jgi:hypothetical protein
MVTRRAHCDSAFGGACGYRDWRGFTKESWSWEGPLIVVLDEYDLVGDVAALRHRSQRFSRGGLH